MGDGFGPPLDVDGAPSPRTRDRRRLPPAGPLLAALAAALCVAGAIVASAFLVTAQPDHPPKAGRTAAPQTPPRRLPPSGPPAELPTSVPPLPTVLPSGFHAPSLVRTGVNHPIPVYCWPHVDSCAP